MQLELPALEWRIDPVRTVEVPSDELGRAVLGVRGVEDGAVRVELEHVREDRVGLLERARVLEDRAIVDVVEELQAEVRFAR